MNIQSINHVLVKAIAGITESELAEATWPKKPTKQIENAIKKWQLYYGSEGKVPIKKQQQFYNQAMKMTNKISDKYDVDSQSVFDAITKEAQRRGEITPMPSKDY